MRVTVLMIVVVLATVVAMVIVVMMVMVMPGTRQQPRGGQIDREAESGDRDRLAKMYGHRVDEAGDSLIADEQGDHGQNDRRGEPGEVAELPGPESKPAIAGVPARIAVRQCRQEQGAGMGRHVQPIGYQGDGAEEDAAHHFQRHHGAAQPDHGPGLPLRVGMPFTEKDMAVLLLKQDGFRFSHDALPQRR